jgi:hypothetical protein
MKETRKAKENIMKNKENFKEYAKKYSKNNHNSKNLNFHEKMKHMCLGQHQH